METDSLFYRLFSEKPKLLFELLGEKVPRTSYTFGSHEIKQTSLRADGILQPRSPKSPIVFVEAQGYLDRKNEVYPVSSPRFSCTCAIKPRLMIGGL